MTKAKSDELDRARIIGEVERYYRVKLTKVEGRRKWLKDKTGKNWWILVGEEDPWHEIPQELLDAARNAQTEGTIVVGAKKLTIMDVFAAPTGQIVKASEKIAGDFEINCRERNNKMIIKEVPNVALRFIFPITYSDEEKRRDRRVAEFTKTLATASLEEQKEILCMLEAQSDVP